VPFERLPKTPAAIVWDSKQSRSVQHFGVFYDCLVGPHLARDIEHLNKCEIADGPWKSMYLELHTLGDSLRDCVNWEAWSAKYLNWLHGVDISRRHSTDAGLFN
jgi:hypothetical protein